MEVRNLKHLSGIGALIVGLSIASVVFVLAGWNAFAVDCP